MITFWLAFVFVVVLILCGGSSREDSLSQIPVRLASVAIIGFFLVIEPPDKRSRLYRSAFAMFAAVACLVVVQLLPLPAVIWTELPGRAAYIDPSVSPQPWRSFNLSPDLGLNAALSLLPIAATLLIVRAFGTTSQSWFLRAFVAAACLSAVIGMFQLAGGADTFSGYTRSANAAVGLFPNRNHHALLLALAIPMTYILALLVLNDRLTRNVRFWIAAFISALIVLIILVVGSRAGLALALVGIGTTYVLLRSLGLQLQRATTSRQRLLRVAIACVGLGLAGAMALSPRAEAVRRLFAGNIIDESRGQTLGTVWRLVTEFFPAGSGFGSFPMVYRQVERTEHLDFNYLNHAHNDVLELVIEAGLPGAALAVILLIWWLRASFQLWFREKSRSESIVFGRLGSVLSLMIFIASLPDYPLRTPLIAAIFVVSCCWMLTARAKAGPAA